MGGSMDQDIFSISGPNHITSIDWNDSYHRTAVMSSLVNAVYIMKKDKTKERKPLANPWWESFGFSLNKTLITKVGGSIYGAVFEYTKYDSYQNTPHLVRPPRYVIAFRGTMMMISGKTFLFDMKQNIQCLLNKLKDGRRFQQAIEAIKTVLDKHPSDTRSVWLAGHSLGASIALTAGKYMARCGSPLETYAFNPPHFSLPLELISKSEVLNEGFRIARSFIYVTVAFCRDLQIQIEDTIAAWTPYLYVNPDDPLSAEYIGDFKHKMFMSKFGASKIENAGAQVSLRSLFSGEGTSSSPSAEPTQYLSSADMTVNKNKSTGLFSGHPLKQWWEPDPARRENWESSRFRP